jgi:hypothetical protein
LRSTADTPPGDGCRRGTPPRCIAIKLPRRYQDRPHPTRQSAPRFSGGSPRFDHPPHRSSRPQPIRASLVESLQLHLVCGRALDRFGVAGGWWLLGVIQFARTCHLGFGASLVVVGSVGVSEDNSEYCSRRSCGTPDPGPRSRTPRIVQVLAHHQLSVGAGPGRFQWAVGDS